MGGNITRVAAHQKNEPTSIKLGARQKNVRDIMRQRLAPSSGGDKKAETLLLPGVSDSSRRLDLLVSRRAFPLLYASHRQIVSRFTLVNALIFELQSHRG